MGNANGDTRANSSSVDHVTPATELVDDPRHLHVFHTTTALDSRLRHVALFMISS